jgi:hypothetical protein
MSLFIEVLDLRKLRRALSTDTWLAIGAGGASKSSTHPAVSGY